MLKFRALPFILLLILAAPLHAAEYRYDEKKSKLFFHVRHLNIPTINGQFKKFTGVFRFDPKKVEDSFVELKIETGSLETGSASRNREFRSNKFFWVDKFPEITFTSKSFKNTGGKKFNISGDLTIRGITKEVIFETELLSPASEALPDKPIFFHTQTYIRRKDFKLGTQEGFDPLVLMTREMLLISLDVEGVPAPGLELPPA